jgi:hypothetical protein
MQSTQYDSILPIVRALLSTEKSDKNQISKSKTCCSIKCANDVQIWLCDKLVKHVTRFHAVHITIFTVGLLKYKVIKQQMIYAAFNPDFQLSKLYV